MKNLDDLAIYCTTAVQFLLSSLLLFVNIIIGKKKGSIKQGKFGGIIHLPLFRDSELMVLF
jgi:hypothetical protein